MAQSEIAAQHNVMYSTATIDGEEAPAVILSSETLRWPELTYKGRTFAFNRDLVIHVTQEEGGWSFAEDEIRLLGFGHTRAEAEFTFCLDFAAQWYDLACEEDDSKLTLGAIKVKRALLALVKSQR
jgi:hypothetical protein